MGRTFTLIIQLIFLALQVSGQNNAIRSQKDIRQTSYTNKDFSPANSSVQQFETSLPILVFDTRGKTIKDEIKTEADFGIIYKPNHQLNSDSDPWNYFKGEVDIELHGASSNHYSPKKSYGIKIIDQHDANVDTSLLGLPREHSFVLHASYFDKTFLRNVLSYKIYGMMGNYGPRTQYVELIINGKYQGVYVLVEKIKRDKNRVDIAKLSPNDYSGNDLTGGYIIKVDRINGNGGQGWYSNFKKDSHDSLPAYFQYDYPSFDSLIQNQKDYIKDYVNKFEAVLNGPYYLDEKLGYKNYIDVSSFVDKFIINEVSKNVDGYRLSEYLYKEKQNSKKKGLLFNGPAWDYDIAWANANFGNATDYHKWQYLEKEGSYYSPTWWRRFMTDSYFKDELYCRYTTFRQTFLDTTSLFNFIDSTAKALKDPLERNFTQWPIMGDTTQFSPTPIPPDYAGEIAVLKRWIIKRLGWMDQNIKGICRPKEVVAGINEEESSGYSIYPNPFNNRVNLNYTLDKKSLVKLEIINAIGVLQHSQQWQQDNSGVNSEEITIPDLAAGVYIFKLTINDKSTSTKLIKMN